MTAHDAITPTQVSFPDADLDDLRDRLARTRWPERETVGDWSQGVPLATMQEICTYWRESYDWRACEARLNAYPQFTTTIDDVDIHFLHVRSPERDATPLVLTHGWPGTVTEFLDVIDALADPVAHGGEASDAFHLVIPSLPGYGFSGKPAVTGWNREHIADAWATMMSRLGYERFAAQGGDWGASVSNHLAMRHTERIIALHLNLIYAFPSKEPTNDPEELAKIEAFNAANTRHYAWEMGYVEEQRTRPQTLGYGLTDSPAGQCAWVLEKFYSWTDCDGDPIRAFGADRLLDNITTFWLTASGTSSARLYWEGQTLHETNVSVPMGGSVFPRELIRPQRHWAERLYTDIRYWNEPPRGGHFAAFEQPELFVDELRAWMRAVRASS